jgi:hypothetical protein
MKISTCSKGFHLLVPKITIQLAGARRRLGDLVRNLKEIRDFLSFFKITFGDWNSFLILAGFKY